MKPWSFFISTFGCKVNQYESQAVREAWLAQGGAELAEPHGADVTLINSCAVTGKAERDARAAITGLERKAPEALHLITGCSAKLAGEAFVGTPSLQAIIPNAHKQALLGSPFNLPQTLPEFSGYPAFSINNFQRSRPILKVQDGCSRHCTYCIVPIMRGPAISRSPEATLNEARNLFMAGFCELIISGINLAQYGRDFNPAFDFWDLAQMLDEKLAPEWAGRVRLRISSLDPNQLNAKAVKVLTSGRLFCPHLHLSLQSGSPDILRRMGRGDQRLDEMLEALGELRRHWPLLGLGADLLTGFPGETEADVQATMLIAQKAGLHYAHVFPFAPRPGTPAASFAEQVPLKEKTRRAASIRDLIMRQGQNFISSLQGRPMRVIADGKGSKKAVNEFYVPCEFTKRPEHGPNHRSLVNAMAIGLKNDSLIIEKI